MSKITSRGVGVGLRKEHYPSILEKWPPMDWFEAISENYMDTGGRPLAALEKVRAHYPVALHGTSMSLGSTDPFHPDYLPRLKKLIDRIDPFIVSDHLCWSGVDKNHLYDLLPLPFTEEAIRHLVSRIQQVQEYLGRSILIENVSTYITFKNSEISEWEFISEISKRSGCGILLDLNNIYVNSVNHHFDPFDYIQNIPTEAVGQFHLAGHTDMGKYLFDTHSGAVIDRVWDLYRKALERFGQVSTLIEWDAEIPSFEKLSEEAAKARNVYKEFPAVVARHEPSGAEAISESQIASTSTLETSRNDRKILLSEIQKKFRPRIQPKRQAFDPAGEVLNPQGGDPGEVRLDVYSNGYVARFQESLSEVFEAVHAVLGDSAFYDLASEYTFHYPSMHYNLNLVGCHFPDFLKTHPLSKKVPFLADLAQLEWQISAAFHAYDIEPINPAQLASIPAEEWEDLRVTFQPSVSLLSSTWPVLDIWLKRHERAERVNIDLENRPQHVLIGRRELQVRCEFLDSLQFHLIKGLLNGQTLGEVCGELADLVEDETEIPITDWFQRWVRDQMIVRCESARQASL